MKFLQYSAYLLAFGAASFALSSCDDDKVEPKIGEVDIELENVVGSSALLLTPSNTTPAAGAEYTNAIGNKFTISKFNYFVSNIVLTKADGTTWAEPESYHFVQETDAASKKLTLTGVPEGDYTKLTFTIGVDSARNVSGAQTGALINDSERFWTWSSGYIYTKMEGNLQPNSSKPLVFHIGGFKTPNNTIRTVSPALPSGTTAIKVRNDVVPEVHLKADVMKMFNGKTNIDFNTLNNVMGGANAKIVADNYGTDTGMFSIAHIHAN